MSRTARTSLLGSSALLLLTVVACSGSTTGGGAGGGACDEYFDALLTQVDNCGGSGVHDVATARARFDQLCANGINAPGASNFASQISACAKTLASSCDDESSACAEATGTLDDGAPCAESYQCKGGACKKSSGSTCGTCATPAAVGQPCDADSSHACVTGATCTISGSSSSTTGTCVAETIAKEGEPCSSTDPKKSIRCDKGLHCDYATGPGSTPTCKAAAKTGEKCETRSDCEAALVCASGKCAAPLAEGATCTGFGGECAKNLGCNPDTKKCAAQVIVKAGEACDGDYQICEKGECQGLSTTVSGSGEPPTITPGKCVDPIPDGGDCKEDGPPCDVFASCINGKCVLEDPSTCK